MRRVLLSPRALPSMRKATSTAQTSTWTCGSLYRPARGRRIDAKKRDAHDTYTIDRLFEPDDAGCSLRMWRRILLANGRAIEKRRERRELGASQPGPGGHPLFRHGSNQPIE